MYIFNGCYSKRSELSGSIKLIARENRYDLRYYKKPIAIFMLSRSLSLIHMHVEDKQYILNTLAFKYSFYLRRGRVEWFKVRFAEYRDFLTVYYDKLAFSVNLWLYYMISPWHLIKYDLSSNVCRVYKHGLNIRTVYAIWEYRINVKYRVYLLLTSLTTSHDSCSYMLAL
jgi:hypothetical protein